MSFSFNPAQGPIYVDGEISGPAGYWKVRLLLDSGATMTLINPGTLVGVGYDPDASPHRVQVTMGGGVAVAPRLLLNRFTALGQHRIGFAVASHPLPPRANVHGLLGLDFFRGSSLTLDFRGGLISLS